MTVGAETTLPGKAAPSSVVGAIADIDGHRVRQRRRGSSANAVLGVAPFVVRTGVIWSGHSRL
jgi:hypothetical protein